MYRPHQLQSVLLRLCLGVFLLPAVVQSREYLNRHSNRSTLKTLGHLLTQKYTDCRTIRTTHRAKLRLPGLRHPLYWPLYADHGLCAGDAFGAGLEAPADRQRDRASASAALRGFLQLSGKL